MHRLKQRRKQGKNLQTSSAELVLVSLLKVTRYMYKKTERKLKASSRAIWGSAGAWKYEKIANNSKLMSFFTTN